jgi:hypothetical protein
MRTHLEIATMMHRRTDGASLGEGEPEKSEHALPLRSGAWVANQDEKSEIAALLRLLTVLANCGLDAAAEPLLQAARTEV